MFNTALSLVLKHEGSIYTNLPQDAGGPTKFGITQFAWGMYTGTPANASDIEHLTLEQATAFYQAWWNQLKLGEIKNQMLAAILMDQSVLLGKSGMTKAIQNLVGVLPDGYLGPQTLAAINATNANNLILDFLTGRIQTYVTIVNNSPGQLVFLRGWENRVIELLNFAFRQS